MRETPIPFTEEQINKLSKEHPTPYHVYDKEGIIATVNRFKQAFSWVPGGFKNYFAVKACPNPYILSLLKEEGFGADCSSMAELVLCDKVGIKGEDIMFSANDTPEEEFAFAAKIGAVINLDDITHIDTLEKAVGIPSMISFRYNPGPDRTGNAIIGNPSEAKYGVTKAQLVDAFRSMKEKGTQRFGLHTMVASNELNSDYFIETARMLFDQALRLKKELDIDLEMINLGGGVGIPYNLDDEEVNIEYVSEGIRKLYEEMIISRGLKPIRIVMECGRVITGPHGFLVTQVRHVTQKYKDYVGCDACMANLMRPALYGAYHHISILGRENAEADHVYDVTGSLCENNDKFAIDRSLPEIKKGDYLVIHDAGAHGYAMGFNYNGKLRSAEFLLEQDGSFKQIRRAETLEDYFATMNFPGGELTL